MGCLCVVCDVTGPGMVEGPGAGARTGPSDTCNPRYQHPMGQGLFVQIGSLGGVSRPAGAGQVEGGCESVQAVADVGEPVAGYPFVDGVGFGG